MINTKTILQLEIARLEALMESVPRIRTERKGGTLRVNGNGSGFTYYYVKQTSDGERITQTVERLGDGSSPKVRKIKRERFARELRRQLGRNIAALSKAASSAEDFDFDGIIKSLPAAFRVEKDCYSGILSGRPGERRLPDSAVRAWMNAPYQKNPSAIINPHTAITGEKVRSKSEVIIYDLLVKYGVPFRYECEIRLIGADGLETVRYPDFMILTADGIIICWEHLGLLSDERYLSGNMSKLALYHKNGFTIGDDLILTSDDAAGCINSEAAARIIESMILPRI